MTEAHVRVGLLVGDEVNGSLACQDSDTKARLGFPLSLFSKKPEC